MKKIGLLTLSFLFPLGILASPKPGDFLTSGSTTTAQMALTFDDGPGTKTARILDLLKEAQVKATFFLLGQNVSRKPTLAKRIVEEGHEVGYHSFKHTNFRKRYKEIYEEKGSVASFYDEAQTQIEFELRSDIKKTKDVIAGHTGVRPRIGRMPHGIDRPWVYRAAKEEGLIMINWSYGADWTRDTFENLKEAYFKALRPGAILLFHDGGGEEKTIRLVEAVLAEAKNQKIEIVPVGDLIGLE